MAGPPLVAHGGDLTDQGSNALKHRAERLLGRAPSPGGAVQAQVYLGQERRHVLLVRALATSHEDHLGNALDKVLGGSQDRRVVLFVEHLLEPLAAFGDRKPAVVIDAIGSSEFEASLHRANGRPTVRGPWPGLPERASRVASVPKRIVVVSMCT